MWAGAEVKPKNQKEGGIQRGCQSLSAEPESRPNTQRARGPALHPDLALRGRWECRAPSAAETQTNSQRAGLTVRTGLEPSRRPVPSGL